MTQPRDLGPEWREPCGGEPSPISRTAGDKIIAHAAMHGDDAARALGPAWRLTAAQIDRFVRQNQTAIARKRIQLGRRPS